MSISAPITLVLYLHKTEHRLKNDADFSRNRWQISRVEDTNNTSSHRHFTRWKSLAWRRAVFSRATGYLFTISDYCDEKTIFVYCKVRSLCAYVLFLVSVLKNHFAELITDSTYTWFAHFLPVAANNASVRWSSLLRNFHLFCLFPHLIQCKYSSCGPLLDTIILANQF